MPDYSDYKVVMQLLKEAQEAEQDIREQARECHLFVTKQDGQWEPQWITNTNDKPRYTFDQVTPIIDQIAGEIEQADFDIKVKPAGGEATKDTAMLYDGLIRNIENISNASEVFSDAARSMVTGGLDGWRVVQKYVDDDSFDQDLVIEKINNFLDRVWFDINAEKRDRSDAQCAWVMQKMSKDAFAEKWPDRAGSSVDQNRIADAYYHKGDMVVVGEFYYIKQEKRDIVLMSNGAVYEDNDEFKTIVDDLAASGITEQKRRSRKKNVVYIRKFDGEGWIEEPKRTVFSYIPVVPTFGNYKILENKPIYHGAVLKLIDPQRVLNYSLSREIEEGALAPRAKYWMTEAQAEGHEDTLATLNTNSDPIQFYNPDAMAPGVPQQNGGAQVNPGLRTISEGMQQLIGKSAGLFAANMGDNPNLQSGVAISKLQERGNTGTIKYFKAQEVAICHTARILIDAIPAVYDTARQVRILNEDGTIEMERINTPVIDNETGQVVMLNDLNQGKYDVTCSAGDAFQNRQQETVKTLVELGKVDPSFIQMAGDILANNIATPGMDQVRGRKRAQLLQAGVIPQDEMTDEEKAAMQAQAAQQGQQPDAMTLAAMAEMKKAEADMAATQTKQQEIQINAQIKQQELQIAAAKLQQDGEKGMISASQKQDEFDLKIAKMQQDLALSMQEQQRKIQETMTNMEKTQAETMQILKQLSMPADNDSL